MKENRSPKPLKESEREELIRLREENRFIKTEIENIKAEKEIIKKLIALRREKWAAQLKAKKQQSSKNLEKKDIIKMSFTRNRNGKINILLFNK